MFQHQGIWLPDGEKHFPDWMTRNGEIVDGKGTYQIKKFREAMKWCKQFRTAVDVGAHVGLWSMQLAKLFPSLWAFEPVPQFRDCWERNMRSREVKFAQFSCLEACALGANVGSAVIKVDPADTGGTHVVESTDDNSTLFGFTPVEMKTLDSYCLTEVNFIKIDCEGYELEVLKGALQTLERCRPCVIVEQKPHKLEPNFGIKGAPAVDYLKELGARVRYVMSGDYIMSWD